MAFGQAAGPPATAKQVTELLALLHDAGHVDFRDARGPMGFNQRQAAGKFTRDEAAAFIDQLQGVEAVAPPESEAEAEVVELPGPDDLVLRRVPAERLAAELRLRGWLVVPPS